MVLDNNHFSNNNNNNYYYYNNNKLYNNTGLSQWEQKLQDTGRFYKLVAAIENVIMSCASCCDGGFH